MSSYGLHAVIIKDMPIDQAQKISQDFIKNKKRRFFRMAKNGSLRFRNISKQKFLPKSFRTKKINDKISLIYGELKPEFAHLKGEGLSDIVASVKKFFSPRLDDYNNVSKNTINQYGSLPINEMFIYRTPIGGLLNTALNFISLGKWEQLKKRFGYDRLFHVALVCNISNKNIIVEKNEVINISQKYETKETTEVYKINMQGKTPTLLDMLNSVRNKLGDQMFFDYDAFRYPPGNCQWFIRNLLESQGLYNKDVNDFLFQDLSEIYENLPSFVPDIAKTVTSTAAFFNKILGKGMDEESDDDFDDDKDLMYRITELMADIEGDKQFKKWLESVGGSKSSSFIRMIMAKRKADELGEPLKVIKKINEDGTVELIDKDFDKAFKKYKKEGFKEDKINKISKNLLDTMASDKYKKFIESNFNYTKGYYDKYLPKEKPKKEESKSASITKPSKGQKKKVKEVYNQTQKRILEQIEKFRDIKNWQFMNKEEKENLMKDIIDNNLLDEFLRLDTQKGLFNRYVRMYQKRFNIKQIPKLDIEKKGDNLIESDDFLKWVDMREQIVNNTFPDKNFTLNGINSLMKYYEDIENWKLSKSSEKKKICIFYWSTIIKYFLKDEPNFRGIPEYVEKYALSDRFCGDEKMKLEQSKYNNFYIMYNKFKSDVMKNLKKYRDRTYNFNTEI